MRSTMQDAPLLISGILRHGAAVYGDSEVVTVEADGYRTTTFAEVAVRAEQLASALRRLGIGPGDRVGTFCWNNQGHLEAYLAVPSMGAVLHTLNIRLYPEQLAYVIDHAEDKVLIVDGSLIPLLARVFDGLKTVETVIVVGPGDSTPLGETLDYEELLAAEVPGFDWPELDERDAAGDVLHERHDRRPEGRRLQPPVDGAPLDGRDVGRGDRRQRERPTADDRPDVPRQCLGDALRGLHGRHGPRHAPDVLAAASTSPGSSPSSRSRWPAVSRRSGTTSSGWPATLTCRRSGRSPPAARRCPRALIEAFRDRVGVPLTQGWGMTETSPMAALGIPPAGCSPEEEIDYRSKAGRIVPGVEVRVVADDGEILPNDGESVGEFEVRGPWVTGSYYKDPDPSRFHDGWLRTGDIGTLDRRGFMQISDRTKDVIKSGGEWISSVELENEVMAHPDVFEAAVIAVADPKWQERPLVVVVPAEGKSPTAQELIDFLQGRVARWWLPERWTFVDEIPKTSVGKFDKKVLRGRYADGDLDVVTIDLPPGA